MSSLSRLPRASTPALAAVVSAVSGALVIGSVVAAPPAFADTCTSHFTGRGSGSAGDPFLVSTRADLEMVTTCPAAAFRQTATIVAGSWTPLAPGGFTGSYDGAGFSVTDLSVNAGASSNAGLFASLGAGAVVRGLTVTGQVFGTRGSYGLLAGRAGVALIEDVAAGPGLVQGHFDIGGVVGSTHGTTVRRAFSEANVQGNGTPGGLDGSVGGLVGYADDSAIDEGFVTGTVSSSGLGKMGGLVGEVYAPAAGSITRSFAGGNVVLAPGGAGAALGGLVGYARVGADPGARLTISGSRALGTVSPPVPASALDAASALGGLVGSLSSDGGTVELTRSAAVGPVAGQAYASDVGGLVGYVGGAAGTLTLSQVTSGSSVSSLASSTFTGGLVGRIARGGASVHITDAAARGPVAGSAVVGGLIGGTSSSGGGSITVTHAYATGRVTGNAQVGGLAGYLEAPVTATSAYWDTQTTERATSAIGEGRTTAQMTQQATYTGWAFGTFGDPAAVWGICPTANSGYPFLQSLQYNDICPGAPTPPRSPAVALSAVATATATWTEPVADGGSPVTSYTVTEAPGGATCVAAATARTCVIGGLAPGEHAFTVTASNALGTSAPSTSVKLTVPGLTAQVATPAPSLPNRIARRGRTVLLTGPVVTNAGQTAIVTVRAKAKRKPPKRLRPFWRTRTNAAGVVSIRLTGRVPCTVTLRLRAPAVPGFTAYAQTRVWTVRAAR